MMVCFDFARFIKKLRHKSAAVERLVFARQRSRLRGDFANRIFLAMIGFLQRTAIRLHNRQGRRGTAQQKHHAAQPNGEHSGDGAFCILL